MNVIYIAEKETDSSCVTIILDCQKPTVKIDMTKTFACARLHFSVQVFLPRTLRASLYS